MNYIDLLKLKGEEAHHLVTYCINGFVLYVAINGGLAKFALDANSTQKLKFVLTFLGLAFGILGFFCCWLAIRVRDAIKADLNSLGEEYSLPILPSGLIAVKYIVIVGVLFASFITVSWIWILFN